MANFPRYFSILSFYKHTKVKIVFAHHSFTNKLYLVCCHVFLAGDIAFMSAGILLVWALTFFCIFTPAPAAALDDATRRALDGATGSRENKWDTEVNTWGTDVQKSKKNNPAPMADFNKGLSLEELILANEISRYFNEITHMNGKFAQTNPDQKVINGSFYLKKPGKIRFDYAPPSKIRIVSNGDYLSIEDHDLKTVDRYPIESTPFRILLQDEVDLLRDGKLSGIVNGPGAIGMTIADGSGNVGGRIRLSFVRAPELQLSEWVVTDPQGLDTRVMVSELVLGEAKEDDFFALSSMVAKDIGIPGQ
jgi:outer membrane lipoprotein-sorting protein